ncbi:unnamed protein product [Schistosoma margrebowiei]|uniref:Uncharacterized protein n=1 Tax=Schistosoma margrebowiei TaxID=48269 RepID=A0AA84Z8X8_9TREM|nr:unnamed protein product [Schistosoma margrebowiei]
MQFFTLIIVVLVVSFECQNPATGAPAAGGRCPCCSGACPQCPQCCGCRGCRGGNCCGGCCSKRRDNNKSREVLGDGQVKI